MLSTAGLSVSGAATSQRVGEVRFRELVASRGPERFYIMYSYLVDGNVVAGDVEAKLRTTWNMLADGRSNGGVMVVAARLGDGDDIQVGRARIRDFVDAALPHATAFLADAR